MGKYLDLVNMDNETGWPKRFVRYKTGAFIFDMSQKQFERMAKECHQEYKPTIFKPCKMVLVDAKVFEEYIELYQERR